MGLQHSTGPRQLSRLLGVGCSGCHLACGRDLAFNSLTVRRGCHWRLGGSRGHSSRPRGGRGPSRRMISRQTSEFKDLATFICIWTFVAFIGPLLLAVRDYVMNFRLCDRWWTM
jgi:hypothetical protein